MIETVRNVLILPGYLQVEGLSRSNWTQRLSIINTFCLKISTLPWCLKHLLGTEEAFHMRGDISRTTSPAALMQPFSLHVTAVFCVQFPTCW